MKAYKRDILDNSELLSLEAIPSGHAIATFTYYGKKRKCVITAGIDFYNYNHSKEENVKSNAHDKILLDCVRIIFFNGKLNDSSN